MKKLLIVVILVLVMPALVLAGAKIFVPETTWDFGLAHKGGPLSHPYWIKNIGNDSLRIDVRPG
jgi:hypothetical protein